MKKFIKRNIVIIGPQASGKGTQAEILAQRFRIPKIATGDIFRKEIKKKTKLGEIALKFINQGKLVPDKITNQVIAKRLKKKDIARGFILDGYPRNLNQARNLDKLVLLDYVFEVVLPEKIAIERISGRRNCVCGQIYHLKYNPPKKEEICDKCGKKLFIREDEKPKVIKQRLKIYHKRTKPLVEYYQKRGILVKIDGKPPISQVSKQILEKLKRA